MTTTLFDCTDNGQHPRTTLGLAESLDGKPPYQWRPVRRQTLVDESRGVWLLTRGGHRVVVIRCPRCRRDVQWREPRANRVVLALLDANAGRLDVSRVNF